jgi:hypothetical protein
MLPSWQAKVDAWLGKGAPRIKDHGPELGYELNLANRSITDLSPLRGMPLGILQLSGNPHITDLSPLAECPLKQIYLGRVNDLIDLSPLRGKALEALQLQDTRVSDLGPLSGARLNEILIVNSPVRSLEALRDQPLKHAHFVNLHINSLEPLANAPLESLDLFGHSHLDLASLKGRSLRQFSAQGVTIDHPEILAEMKDLERVAIPTSMTDPGILRNLPHLQKIVPADAPNTSIDWKSAPDAADFWQKYDAAQAKNKSH